MVKKTVHGGDDPISAEAQVRTRRGNSGVVRGATLKDVAELAGVSLMTVSNVVNQRFRSMRVETRVRVEEAIEKLNYRPNMTGQSLRSRKQLSVGLIVVNESSAFLADPFISYLVAGLSNYLNDLGYVLSIQGMPAAQVDSAALLRGVRTDGLCVKLSGGDAGRLDIVESLSHCAQPIIMFQEPSPDGLDDICSVRQNDYAGGLWLGMHVSQRQISKAVVLKAKTPWPAFHERERGIRDGLKKGRSDCDVNVVTYSGDPFVGAQAALDRHLRRWGQPDAVFGLNDQAGIGAIKFFQERGARIPEDVVVTGFNAFGFREYSDPVLTTVRSCAYEVGARGAEELLRRLAKGSFDSRDVVLPVVPVEGGST